MGWVTITQKVVPASCEALEKFSFHDLGEYAKAIGIGRCKTKKALISAMLKSGKATLCSSLGN